jgi:hypothetical protein
MSQITFIRVGEGDDANIFVYVPGHPAAVAHSSHPNFQAIAQAAAAGDVGVLDLFDVGTAINVKFARYGDRITVVNDEVLLDGDPMEDVLVDQILRVLEEGGDVMPLVLFYENLLANPNEHSRDNLTRWMQALDADGTPLTITEDGLIVGYKGVKVTDKGFASISSGKALVNDQVKTGQIPQTIGDVVTMPRSEVEFDPSQGCRSGLHVGTYKYAEGFSQGALLEVHVNPRDVVSVPTDCNDAKMRCCRYVVIDTIDKPYRQAVKVNTVVVNDLPWGDDEDDVCEDCGEYLDDCECELEDNFTPDSEDGVTVGDVYEDADKRGARRTLTVLGINRSGYEPKALTRSNATGREVMVKISRLKRSKYYRKVS